MMKSFKQPSKRLEALGVKAKGYVSNAANFDDSQRVVNDVVKDFTRIDILINNAGITQRYITYANDRGSMGFRYCS